MIRSFHALLPLFLCDTNIFIFVLRATFLEYIIGSRFGYYTMVLDFSKWKRCKQINLSTESVGPVEFRQSKSGLLLITRLLQEFEITRASRLRFTF